MFAEGLFDGKVAIVTGAARGIGLATAESLGSLGAHVVLVDLDQSALDEATTELSGKGIKSSTQVLDVSDADAVRTVFEELAAEHGHLDVLINNAGIVTHKQALDHSDDEWRRQIQVNLDGTYFCAKAGAKAMVAGNGGSIVNLASLAALSYTMEHAAYAAAKAGVIRLTADMAYELGPQGVRVNCVAPGFILTPLLHATVDKEAFGNIFRLGRWGVPNDIAYAVTYLASDAASFVTGQTLTVAGGCDLRTTQPK